jgi:hypothetical protein
MGTYDDWKTRAPEDDPGYHSNMGLEPEWEDFPPEDNRQRYEVEMVDQTERQLDNFCNAAVELAILQPYLSPRILGRLRPQDRSAIAQIVTILTRKEPT